MARELGRARGWQGPLLNVSAVSKGAKPACEPCRMRRIPKTPHRARGEVIWWHATELDVASRRAGAFSFEMFLTRCFSPESPRVSPHMRHLLLYVFFVFLCHPLAVSFRSPRIS